MSRLALLFPLWLALLVAEPGLVHRCPAHDAAAGGIVPGGHAHHANHTDDQQERAPCTCVGSCCTASTVSWALPADTPLSASVVVVASRAFAPSFEHIEADAQLRLPFANGPPSGQPVIQRA